MKEEAHVSDNNLVNVGKQLIGGVIAELTGSEGVEATDPAQESALLSQLLVDKGGHGTQSNQPSPLDKVHLVVINNIVIRWLQGLDL